MHRDEVVLALPDKYAMKKLFVRVFRPFQEIIDTRVACESGRLADMLTPAWWWLYDLVFSIWGGLFQVQLMWCERCKINLGRKQIVAARWEKVWVVFEDEPPMFFKWVCPECGTESAPQASMLTESCVKELGYNDFNEYAIANIVPAIKEKEKK